MSRIFISHSSRDNAAACAIRRWLELNGWDDVFLDLDPQRGLLAGDRWQDALSRASHRCEAVVFVVSKAWAASKWCSIEFSLAKSLGKRVFGVLIEEVPFADLPSEMTAEHQLTDLSIAGPQQTLAVTPPGAVEPVEVRFSEAGLTRLRFGLEQAGLDASSFPLDTNRPLYPGLRALDTPDAAIFFGRDADIVRGMDLIRVMRATSKSVLVILGASGSGKSSFLRAGLWPRLRRSDREFLVLPVLRPADAPVYGEFGLVESLYRCATEHLGMQRTRAHFRALFAAGQSADALEELLQEASKRLAEFGMTRPPLIVLPVDQAEELFLSRNEEEAHALLNALAPLLRSGRLLVAFSMRSDAYSYLQESSALEGLEQKVYPLAPITRGTIKEVIEGPARRDQLSRGAQGLKIDPLLTDRLLNEWSGTDALPLLAFTLRRLVEDYGGDGSLDLHEYETAGGLTGALEAAVNDVLDKATLAGLLPADGELRKQVVRRAFVPWLVNVDPQSREPLRRVARFDAFPDDAMAFVDRLVEARLLNSFAQKVDGKEVRFVEVAHEALLRQWPLLSAIIDQERATLCVLNEVKRDALAWNASGRSEETLLHWEGRLKIANALLDREELKRDLGSSGKEYLDACRSVEDSAVELESIKQTEHANRIRRIKKSASITAVAGLAIVILAVYALALKVVHRLVRTNSETFAVLAQQAIERGQPEQAMRFALLGTANHDSPVFGFDATGAELQLAAAAQLAGLSFDVTHGDDVNDVDLNKDGSLVLTASDDGTARTWDARKGTELHVLRHEEPVVSASFSPDGTIVATGSYDDVASLWSTSDGKLLFALRHPDDVNTIEFDRAGTRVVTGSDDGIARVFDVATGELLTSVKSSGMMLYAEFDPTGTRLVTSTLDSADIWDIASGARVPLAVTDLLAARFSPDGTMVATVSDSSTAVTLWNAIDGSKIAELDHDASVNSVDFSPDGSIALTASDDGTARLWVARDTEGQSGDQLASIAHGSSVETARFTGDGQKFVTGSLDGSVRVFDVNGNLVLDEPAWTHGEQVSAIAFSGDGTWNATSSYDGTVHVWKAGARELFRMNHEEAVNGATFSADGSRIVTSSDDRAVHLFDAVQGRELARFEADSATEKGQLSADGSRMVAISGDGGGIGFEAVLWDAGTGARIASWPHEDGVVHVQISADSQRVLTSTMEGSVHVWSAVDGRAIATFAHPSWVPEALFVDGAGTRVVTASYDDTARLWDVATATVIHEVRHDADVNSIAVSLDGRMFATASDDGTVRILDADFDELAVLSHGKDHVGDAQFSPDGLQVATRVDNVVTLWDRRGMRRIASVSADSDVASIAYNAKGTRLAIGSMNGRIAVFDARSGGRMAEFSHRGSVSSVSFSSDGNRLLSASWDGTVRVWDTTLVALEGNALVEQVCRGEFRQIALQRDAERFGRLTPEDFRLAPTAHPVYDADACAPASDWQRVVATMGWRDEVPAAAPDAADPQPTDPMDADAVAGVEAEME